MELPPYNIAVRVTTACGATFNARRMLMDEWPCWMTAHPDDDDKCPYDWTNGVCWISNEHGHPSSPVVSWSIIE